MYLHYQDLIFLKNLRNIIKEFNMSLKINLFLSMIFQVGKLNRIQIGY